MSHSFTVLDPPLGDAEEPEADVRVRVRVPERLPPLRVAVAVAVLAGDRSPLPVSPRIVPLRPEPPALPSPGIGRAKSGRHNGNGTSVFGGTIPSTRAVFVWPVGWYAARGGG